MATDVLPEAVREVAESLWRALRAQPPAETSAEDIEALVSLVPPPGTFLRQWGKLHARLGNGLRSGSFVQSASIGLYFHKS